MFNFIKNRKKEIYLILIFIISVIFLFVLKFVFTEEIKRDDYQQMREANVLAQKWFNIICKEKEKMGITSGVNSKTTYSGMLGSEYTLTTTTLGSLEAKELSCNPDFSALIVRLICESEAVIPGDNVLVLSSGSFPSLMISTLSAIEILNLKPIIISSLGASMYGANQPEATWLDMENWLKKSCNFSYSSSIITLGGEGDNGGGLTNEGVSLLNKAITRNNVTLTTPESFTDAINLRTDILESKNISLLINIGGNQTSLGRCNHSLYMPNGLVNFLDVCEHKGRGILMQSIELGIPYIHLLGIKDLALEYGIEKYYKKINKEPQKLYMNKHTSTFPVIASIITIMLLLLLFYTKMIKNNKK